MSTPRELDLVVFGATGFTGGLVAAYLAERLKGSGVRWALAGRNAGKLEAVRSRVVALDSSLSTLPLLVADGADETALTALAARTRVVLTTVGPFAQHGLPLARACAASGTDYVDITGEPDFVDELIRSVDPVARTSGARLVSCCGFDSVPHDLGAYFTVKQLGGSEPVDLVGVVRASGTFSGGTFHSAVGAFSKLRGRAPSPRVPVTGEGRKVGHLASRVRWSGPDKAWLVPLPTIDPQIVLRSARALPAYGPAFRYAHTASIRKFTTIVGGGVVLGGAVLAAQFGPTRRALLKWKPQGEGPTAEERARAKFSVTFSATTPTRSLRTRVSGGDPGYDETAKMVSECALAFVQDAEKLDAAGGVKTPAQAFGDVLVDRLMARGIRFEVL